MAIKIGKDGSITRDGKTYKNKAAYKKAEIKAKKVLSHHSLVKS